MNEIFATAETKMNKSLNNMSSEFAAIRAGRANPGVLDRISVDYYGCPTPVNQMAAVAVAGHLPLTTLAVFLTIAVALGNAKTMIRSRKEGVELIHDLDVRTANLQLFFSVLFTAALVVAKFL